MLKTLRFKIRNWLERNPGKIFTVTDRVFEVSVNFCLAALLISLIFATVLSAFRGDGIDTLIYAVSSLIIALITRIV